MPTPPRHSRPTRARKTHAIAPCADHPDAATLEPPARGPSATRRTARREPTSQLALWTLRAVIHTGAYRAYLEAKRSIDDDILLDVGLPELVDENMEPHVALPLLRHRQREIEAGAVSREGSFFANVDKLGDLLGLTPLEREIIAFLVAAKTHAPLDTCLDHGKDTAKTSISATLAPILGARTEAVREALRAKGTLMSARLLASERGFSLCRSLTLTVTDSLETLLQTEMADDESIVRHFIQPAVASSLSLADFPHVATDVAVILRLLDASLRERTPGVNILVHGAPGTGKTELARVIAAKLAGCLYEVNVEDSDGDPLEGSGRASMYAISQRLLGRSPRALVLFDEVEDLFPRRWNSFFGVDHGSGKNKGWINRLLESNPVPTFWLSNAVDQMDPAYVRRFDYVMELRTPPTQVRRRIIEKYAGSLPLRAEWVQRLASDERVTPAHVERAVAVAIRIGVTGAEESEATVSRTLENTLSAQGLHRTAHLQPVAPLRYDLSLLRTSHDIDRLLAGLVASRRGTVCLHGPPGTGKTAFVRHLAEQLGVPLLAQRASDLLSPYVGVAEAQIASMFRRARDEQALLFLDEADSFLQDRARAHHSWEITQVNELLVQMEAFDGLFVCATNLMDTLDAASLRRFSVKVRFDYPAAPQRWRLFESALSEVGGAPMTETEASHLRDGIERLANLAPGDFATVLRQAKLLGGRCDASGLLDALVAESEAKQGT
ncbi:MAG: AAA family ATPase, partial [Deltaproteobacteria bacterium]